MDLLISSIYDAGASIFCHPNLYITVIKQITHEYIPPKVSTTLFGKPIYLCQIDLKNIKRIYRTKGVLGFYEGFRAGFIGYLSYKIVSASVYRKLTRKSLEKKEEEFVSNMINDNFDVIKDIKETAYEVIAVSAAVVCSQPFYVISIRTMAQFAGSETRYSGIFAGMSDIWNNEGIPGFFSGLVPKLISEAMTIVMVNLLRHAVKRIAVKAGINSPFKIKVLRVLPKAITSSITYPIELVSVVMMVNNSGLAAASPPLMPIYENWWSCLKSLKANDQFMRGSIHF